MEHRRSPLIRFLQFLGKVQFTMILLLAGVVVMTVGTVIESRQSRELAQSVIYGAFWFDTFLFLIGLNLVIAVINRIPIQRHQWAFVLVHFSIVILLVGSWVSHTFGYEGRTMIYEGREENQLFLGNKRLRVTWDGGSAIFPIEVGDDLTGQKLQGEDGNRPGFRVLEHVPRGTKKVQLGEGGKQDPPGIKFIVRGEQEYINDWEIANGGRATIRDVGPLEVQVVPVPSESFLEARKKAMRSAGYRVILHAPGNSSPFVIPLPEGLGKEVVIGDGVVAKVESFFLHARLIKGTLEDIPSATTNPAAVVEISAASGTERHTLFSKFPDFNATHNRDPNQKLVDRLTLLGVDNVAKPRVSVLIGPDEQLHLQLTTPRGTEAVVPIAVKERIPLESIGLNFEVTERLLHARRELLVRPVPEDWQGGEGTFLQVEVSANGVTDSFWMEYGMAKVPELAGGKVKVLFDEEVRTLPFSIALKEFEVVNYPGSNRPSEYRSQITITPASKDLPPREEVISMNRPLDEQGFRLFQSSYQLGQGNRPDATILSISYDPGVLIVYISFALIVLGITWYLRNQSRQAMMISRAVDRAQQSSALAGNDERE